MKKKLSIVLACALLVSLFGVLNVHASDISKLSEIKGSGTYTLTGDTAETAEFKSGDIVLDLNGYTVTGQITLNGANLTIKDSSADGTGKIVCPFGDDNDTLNVLAGSLTVDGGTIEAGDPGNDGIWIEGGATVTINNGKISGANSALQNRYGTVTINGGKFESSHVALKVSGKAATGPMTITINGGVFYSAQYNVVENGAELGICLNVNEDQAAEWCILGEGVTMSDDGEGTYTATKAGGSEGDPTQSPSTATPTPGQKPNENPNPPSTGDADFIVAAIVVVVFAGIALVAVKKKTCR